MNRVFVDIDSPWSTRAYEMCPIINEDYIPISYLAPMLEVKVQDLLERRSQYVTKKIEKGGVYRNFIKIEELPTLLAEEGWSQERIERGLNFFNQTAPAPMKKRGMDDDEDVYLKKGPTKRKEIEETIPNWAQGFMEECRKTVGDQAVERFMETDDYVERCKEAITDKMRELEKDLRKQLVVEVKKELKEEYKIQARQEFEKEQREKSMEPFKLKFNRELNDNLTTFAFASRFDGLEPK
jgi:hypothetical protein